MKLHQSIIYKNVEEENEYGQIMSEKNINTKLRKFWYKLKNNKNLLYKYSLTIYQFKVCHKQFIMYSNFSVN